MTSSNPQDPPPPATDPSSTDAGAPALGTTAAKGAAFTTAATVFAKICGFLATIPLGILLAAEDYGVYATAIAFSAFIMVMRDGGVRELLVSRGPKEYDDLVGPVFWLAVVVNLITAGVLSVLAPSAASWYAEAGKPPDHRITQILWILAAALVLNTFPLLLRAKLRIDLRFGLFSKISAISAVVQHGGAVVCALLGFGPLSFAIPFVLVALFEWIALSVATREWLWTYAPRPSRWGALLWQTRWLIIGSFTALTLNMGPNLVLGALITKSVLGIYFFGYQLVAQVAVLMSHNVQVVLLPTFVRLIGDDQRFRSALLRALRALVMVSAPISLTLAVVFPSLEQLIWKGKWAAAVAPVQLLALVFPVRVTYGLATSALKSQGHFKAWALLTLVQGGGVMTVAFLTGRAGLDAAGIATWIAAYLGVSSMLMLWIVMRRFRVGVVETARAVIPSWGLAVMLAGLLAWLDAAVLSHAWVPILRVMTIGGAFVLSYAIGARLLMPIRVRETVGVLPARLRPLATRVLRLA